MSDSCIESLLDSHVFMINIVISMKIRALINIADIKPAKPFSQTLVRLDQWFVKSAFQVTCKPC